MLNVDPGMHFFKLGKLSRSKCFITKGKDIKNISFSVELL